MDRMIAAHYPSAFFAGEIAMCHAVLLSFLFSQRACMQKNSEVLPVSSKWKSKSFKLLIYPFFTLSPSTLRPPPTPPPPFPFPSFLPSFLPSLDLDKLACC